MLRTHPSREELTQFMYGRLPVGENRSVLRHLVGGCPECSEIAAALWPVEERTASDAVDYELAFFKASLKAAGTESTMDCERRRSDELWAELRKHPLPRQMMIVRNSRRFQTWGLCERVVRSTLDQVYEDPTRAIEFGEVAVALSEQLDDFTYSAEILHDLQARAWSMLGNAHRVSDHWQESADCFDQAEALLETGTGDPLESALLLAMRARFLGARREFPEALALLNRAIKMYRSVGDEHEVGCLMIDQSNIYAETGDLERSIELLQAALGRIDEEENPRRLLIAKHNLVISLQEIGRLDEAIEILEEVRPMYHQLGDRMNLIRLEWVEAQIARAQGETLTAEEAFRKVRAAFADRNLAYDAALVSLELSSLYLEEHRAEEVKGLVAEMISVFTSLGIHREAIAAVMVLQQALELQQATVHMVTEVARFIEKSRRNPKLSFSYQP